MAVRQYIGARYVAKIYVNSQDASSADWESGVAYEPLTMVTYNSSSYISRKDVPASVGNPVDNPSYWAVTGLYNGQIIALDNRITAIETLDGSTPLPTTAQTLTGSIDEIHTKISGKWILSIQQNITVTADGVKTYSDLLKELYSAINSFMTSLSGSHLFDLGYINIKALPCPSIMEDYLMTSPTGGYSAQGSTIHGSGIVSYTIYVTNTNPLFRMWDNVSNAVTDLSITVPTSGETITAAMVVYDLA